VGVLYSFIFTVKRLDSLTSTIKNKRVGEVRQFVPTFFGIYSLVEFTFEFVGVCSEYLDGFGTISPLFWGSKHCQCSPSRSLSQSSSFVLFESRCLGMPTNGVLHPVSRRFRGKGVLASAFGASITLTSNENGRRFLGKYQYIPCLCSSPDEFLETV